MFSFLKGKKNEISLALDRPNGIYFPGETVGVTITILPDKELKVRGGQVKLGGTEKYEYETTQYTTDSDGDSRESSETVTAYHELCELKQDFLGETVLLAGTPQSYTVQLTLPADALPSCTAKIVTISWQVFVKLDRPRGGDPHAEAELRVSRPLPSPAPLSNYGTSNEPKEADLTLVLPGLEAAAGQTFAGELRVLPHKDFSSDVRVELVRDEYVPRDRGNSSQETLPFKLAANTRFVAEQPQTFPFQAVLPPTAAPSLDAPHSSLTWTIKGILARRLRKDTSVEQELQVYPAGQ